MVLELYVKIAEENNFMRSAVTLTVNGLIITGQTITASEYSYEIMKHYYLDDFFLINLS
jgi:hypothetical protein